MDALDAIFIPIGGGGLAAGIAAYVKALKPNIKVGLGLLFDLMLP
jgi:threonine dehydratase